MRRLLLWFRTAPGLWALVVAGSAIVVSGSVMAYRTYDYIEHDNDFCLSCHLMREPFDLFARSAHRGLGCKACHKPSFVGRSEMALTQLIQQPDSLTAQAEVPNEKCASCHIDGDPDKWKLVASSAGHRVHFESDDPDLAGLQCVECHSSSLHEFAATDQTCTQSGCHTDVEVRLGKMSGLGIHCVACHAFNVPVQDTAGFATASEALQPASAQCLSCHAMRTIVDVPADEPHDAVCSTCHKPHDQTSPDETVETCASGGCHDDVENLSPFHRGLEPPVLEGCVSCHKPHEFRAEGDLCLSCHEDVFRDVAPPGKGPGGSAPAAAPVIMWPASTAAYLHGPAVEPLDLVRTAAVGGSPDARPARVRVPAADTVPSLGGAFRHGQHRDVQCTACHVSGERHGALTVQGIGDCRGCHHAEPAERTCETCHTRSETQDFDAGDLAVRHDLALSVGTVVGRTLPFSHDDHSGTSCETCHQAGPEMRVEPASCDGCHDEHHESEAVRCASCHLQAPAEEHPLEVHVGCEGAGCHTSTPFEAMPRTRNACLVCHQDQEDHEPERECIDCHLLPPARGGD